MLNTTHFFYDVDHAIDRLEFLYSNPEYRADLAERGYKVATKKEFQWKAISKQFDTLIRSAKGTQIAQPQMSVPSGKPAYKVWEKQR